VLAPEHPLLVPAPPHEPEVTALIASADLAIVVGSDLDQMNTMQWRLPLPARRIAINVDALDAAKNYACDAVIETDARILGLFAEQLDPRDPWAGDLGALGDAIRARIAQDDTTAEAIAFLEHTETALPANAVVFADMCVAGYWLAGHLRVPQRRGLHYPMGWGSLGFAPGAAIGAAAAGPDAPTVAFVGDGGMLFALGELSALAEQRAPCTIIVIDDNGYGMLRYGPQSTAANELPPVDFVQAARAFGIPAVGIDGVGATYAKALAQAVERAEPSLLHVRARLHPPVTTTPFWPIKDGNR
jgi:acetolactate synthase-1/2/3 large subunit